ncbi:MAG: hypothetical protein MR522_02485 [Trueperella sp.]|uniref:hypothetical protein n=1 Tax=Trueperella sp. TaxID=2699835 RepID=UPI0025EAD923|nr:hypothetical protein [Trueperella sp.]MCI7305125.1 hypothetical protein [Trueperella sp.]
MNTYAQAGQRIVDRFDLLYPYEYQPSDHASVWVARDVVLSRHVRAIVVDPDSARAQATIDAAHRASLVADPHLVSIVQVDSEDLAIITEIPPGKPLAQHLIGTPLPPEQVAAIMGETSSAIAAAARRGVRHLHCTADTIFLTQEGDVIVDGLGVYGALAGADTSKDRADLDRDEARGLTVLCASLLLGRGFPEPAKHDAVIAEALLLDLPPVLDSLLSRESQGQGAASPADLTRALVPWKEIDVATLPAPAAAPEAEAVPSVPDIPLIPVVAPKPAHPKWPALRPDDAADPAAGEPAHGDPATEESAEAAAPEAGETLATDVTPAGEATEEIPATGEAEATNDDPAAGEARADGSGGVAAPANEEQARQPAETTAEAAHVVDEVLGLNGEGKLSSPVEWPGLPTQPDEPKAGPKRVSVLDSAITETERITRTSMSDQGAEPAPTTEPVAAAEPPTEPLAKPAHTDLAGLMPAAAKPAADAATSAAAPKPTLAEYERERKKKLDVSKVVLPLFMIGVVFFGWLGLRTLTAPVSEVTLMDPDTNLAATNEATPTPKPTEAEPTPTPKPTAAPAIATAALVSPDAGLLRGTDPATQDNPSSVPLAVDGNAETSWKSWTYTSPDMSPMSGIGLYVELKQEATITEVTLDTAGNSGGNIQIRDTVKEAPSAGKVLAEGPVDGSTTFTLSEPLTATSFIIWITELPKNSSGEPQIIVSEIHVK